MNLLNLISCSFIAIVLKTVGDQSFNIDVREDMQVQELKSLIKVEI